MAEGRYFALSMAEIAAEAGTTKPSLYLRYRTKGELAIAALDTLARKREPLPLTGDLRTDLIARLRQFRANLTQHRGMLLTGVLLLHEADRPEWLQLFRERIVPATRAAIREVIVQAMARGEVTPDADVETGIDLLLGYWHASYYQSANLPDDWPARGVDMLLAALLARK
jgi:AcrR family transcriptional regulator